MNRAETTSGPGQVSDDDTAPPPTQRRLADADGTAPERAAAPAGDAAPRRPRWLIPVLVVGFLANLAWRLYIARELFTPIVFGDESRYLIFARVLSGGAGGYGGDTEATRRAGYALLISPAYWFTSDPFLVHRLVQVVNAVISAATFPLAYLFARRILDTDRLWGICLALVASSLPAVTFFAPFALPNAVFTPLLLLWLLAMHAWWTTDRERIRYVAATGAGAVVGLMYVIHVRAVLLLGVYGAALLLLLVLRRIRLVHAAVTIGGAALLALVHPVLKAALHGQVITGGTEPEDRMTAAFTTVAGILRTGSDSTGQIWYVMMATWGLGAFGLVLLGHRLISDRRRLLARDYRWPSTLVLLVALASTAAVAVITSAALPDDGKVNNHIFPGYIIFLAPLWAMVGLAALRTAPRRVVVGATTVAATLTLLSWFIVELYSRPKGPIGLPGLFSPIDAPEALFLVGDWRMVHLARVTAITVGLTVLIGAVFLVRRFPHLAVGLVFATVVVNVFALQASTEQMLVIARSHDGPQLVRDAGVRRGEVVAVDTRLVVRFNHQREVYWRPLVDVDLSRQDPPSDVDVVIGPWFFDSSRDWNGAEHGWVYVTGFRSLNWAMWRRAG